VNIEGALGGFAVSS
jgi:hypothetical protein